MPANPHKPKGRARVIPANPQGALLPYQAQWVRDRSLLKIMAKGRQTGISWTDAYAQVEQCAQAGALYDSWISSRDASLAVQYIEDSKHWTSFLKLVADDLGEVVIDVDQGRRPITARQIRFASGRSIYSLSSNPDAQAGRRGNRTLDEFALHPDPRTLFAIAQPGTMWGGQMSIISTHRGSHNFFNDLIIEVQEKGNPRKASLHTVTFQQALDQGLLYKIQQKLAPDDPRLEMDEAEYFDFVRAFSPDEETFQQEYMCRPSDDAAAFLSYDLIAACEYHPAQDWTRIEDGRLFAGIDIGREQDLTVLWVMEKLGDVFYTRHIETLARMRKSDQEKILWPWIDRCERTCIDQTGLGIGWVDDAVDRFGARVEGVTFTGPSKEALAFPLRGAFEDRAIRLPADEKIRADLRKVKKTTTAAGNIRFDAQRDAGGHADRFWALALALHAGGGQQREYEYIPVAPQQRGRAGNDPFADLDEDNQLPVTAAVGGRIGQRSGVTM